MSNTDDPRTDPADPASPWHADTFDRWLAALDLTDIESENETDDDAEAGAHAAVEEPGDVGNDAGGNGSRGPADAAPDPWADLDLDPVDLSRDQREYLAWHEHQPAVPRLHGAVHEPDED